MQATRPSYSLLDTAGARRQTAPRTAPGRIGRRLAGINPWVVICLLALAGWSIDSMLVSIELHRLDGGDFGAHLTHFWYGPPILLALLLLVRTVLPNAALWVPRLTAGTIARCGIHGDVKRLANRLASNPVEGRLLSVLLRYEGTAMAAEDLAGYAKLSHADAAQALSGLLSLGLVDELELAGTRFYRLTRNSKRREALRELRTWHSWHMDWQVEADRAFGLTARDPETGG